MLHNSKTQVMLITDLQKGGKEWLPVETNIYIYDSSR